MADLLHKPLLDIEEQPRTSKKPPRVASLDVFRGLCVLVSSKLPVFLLEKLNLGLD